jgi:hypothetical protein
MGQINIFVGFSPGWAVHLFEFIHNKAYSLEKDKVKYNQLDETFILLNNAVAVGPVLKR